MLNGEPTGLRVQIANGGYMFFRLTTRGVTQHASYRQFGVDAIEKMERVLPSVRDWEAAYRAKFTPPFVVPRVHVGVVPRRGVLSLASNLVRPRRNVGQ